MNSLLDNSSDRWLCNWVSGALWEERHKFHHVRATQLWHFSWSKNQHYNAVFSRWNMPWNTFIYPRSFARHCIQLFSFAEPSFSCLILNTMHIVPIWRALFLLHKTWATNSDKTWSFSELQHVGGKQYSHVYSRQQYKSTFYNGTSLQSNTGSLPAHAAAYL